MAGRHREQRTRYEGNLAAATTSYQEISIAVPLKGIIKRVRAVKNSGTGATVAIEVRESASATGLGVVLAYSATAFASMDSEEDLHYEVTADTALDYLGSGQGYLYVAVLVDAGADTDLDVELTIEEE